MKRFLLLTVCCLTALGCWAQEEGYTYEGTVIDQDRNPIEGAIVSLSAYTIDQRFNLADTTDANGRFGIKLPVNSKFDLYGSDITATAQGHTPFYHTGQLLEGLNIVLYNTLKYQEGQLYSIVLPIVPDASKGRYFRLDRKEGTSLIFERELSPKANVPYAFIPNCNFQINIADLDLTPQITDTKIYGDQKMGITFKGSYTSTNNSINGNAVSSYVDNVLTETNEDITPLIEAMHAAVVYHWMEFEDAPKGQPELVIHDPEEDYVPFVSKLKQWHVLGFSVGPLSSVDDYTFAETEVEKDGKDYLPLLKNWKRYDGTVKPDTCGLFREEGQRVYRYDTAKNQEYCVYDFTLEVGDTFDIDTGNKNLSDRCVVTEIGEEIVAGKHLRTIMFSSVDAEHGGMGGHKDHVWTEGIGDKNKPYEGWYYNYVPSDWTYRVAYMLTVNEDTYDYGFYPFTFFNVWGMNNWVIGHELTRGKEMDLDLWYKMVTERTPMLQYEIADSQIHITGYMDLNCAADLYAYCKISPYEGSLSKYQISVETEETGLISTCGAYYSVELYFDLPRAFDDGNYEFVAIDDDGEHPVPQHSYRPFVEDGKVWKVGLFESEALNAYQLQYYYFENDTTIEDLKQKNITGKKLMRRTEDKDTRKTEYIATIHEEDRHVYHISPNGFVWTITYDFASKAKEVVFFGSPVYPHTDFWGTIDSKSFIEDAYFKGFATKVSIKDLDGEQVEWLEGIGTRISPVNNIGRLQPDIEAEALLSCTVGNDTLFHNPRYTEEISPIWEERKDEAEVKKEKIDFTHVVKTKPMMPRRVATNEEQEAKVGAEVSELSLDITFSGLSGSYTVSLRNEADELVFTQQMETDNLRSLDVRLANYKAGRYIVTVENDYEYYIASFQLEGSAIRPVCDHTTDASLYDLTGRRLSHRPMHGIYLQGGRKRVVR